MTTGNTTTEHWRELVLLACLALLWGSSYLWIRIAVTEIPPVTLIAIRVLAAAIFLAVIMVWQNIPLPKDWQTWKHLFIQSALNSTGAWVLLAWGQQYIDSGLASVLNSTSPLFVFIGTYLFTRHEATNPMRLLGASLGVVGVALIVGPDVLAGLGQQVAGQLAALVSAMMYAGAAIYGKRFSYLPATATAAGTTLWAALCLIPASLIIDRPWTLTPSNEAIAASLILGVFCTGLALLIYFRLLRTLGSLGTASQSYLRAGFGVLLGMIFLGEQITPLVGIGLTAALLGVALINFPTRKNPSR